MLVSTSVGRANRLWGNTPIIPAKPAARPSVSIDLLCRMDHPPRAVYDHKNEDQHKPRGDAKQDEFRAPSLSSAVVFVANVLKGSEVLPDVEKNRPRISPHYKRPSHDVWPKQLDQANRNHGKPDPRLWLVQRIWFAEPVQQADAWKRERG